MENETKLCKHCKSEIPKGAKVCPNCRKKQGGIGKWIVIVVVVVIIIAAMSGGGADKPKKVENASTQNNTDNKADVVNDTTEDTSVKQEDSEKDIFGIGETAEMNDVQVTMVNYTQSSGSEYNKPADGNEFVLVEFEIANNSDSEINISSMASFEAYADDYALNYSVSALLEKNDQNHESLHRDVLLHYLLYKQKWIQNFHKKHYKNHSLSLQRQFFFPLHLQTPLFFRDKLPDCSYLM